MAHPQNNRWYDRQPLVKQSIELLGAFPNEMLTLMAEGVNTVIEREYKVQELMRSFKSLGEEKVLALYKAKKKLRKLDQNPMMHRTVNYLFVISEENKLAIAGQVLDLINTVHEYLQLCKRANHNPTLQHMLEIRNAYVVDGPEAAKLALAKVRQEIGQVFLATQLASPAPLPPPKEIEKKPRNNGQLQVKEDGQGMKINFNIE